MKILRRLKRIFTRLVNLNVRSALRGLATPPEIYRERSREGSLLQDTLPPTAAIEQIWRMYFAQALGDGQHGQQGPAYWQKTLRCLAVLFLFVASLIVTLTGILLRSPILWGAGLLAGFTLLAWVIVRVTQDSPIGFLRNLIRDLAQVTGYRQGAKDQARIDLERRAGLNGIFFILSGIPIDDSGGGARCTQLALELLHQGYEVVFVNRFPKNESQELNLKIVHADLLTYPFKRFSLEKFLESHRPLIGNQPLATLVEFPLADFLPLVNKLRQVGAFIIYDTIDAWDASLGANWYTEQVELEVCAQSDALTATAPQLASRLVQLTGRQVTLLPNAVNLRLFDPKHSYPRPEDLPQAEWTVIFFGALWGDWLDWELLAEAARRYPAASLVIIGDYRGQCPESPSNLHFLGLKSQSVLPAYLAHAQVACLPWKVTPVTLATSPIKIYEYLAMRKPVVVPNLPLLCSLPFVFPSSSRQEFLDNLQSARFIEVGGEKLDVFLRENSWEARVAALTAMLPAIPTRQVRIKS